MCSKLLADKQKSRQGNILERWNFDWSNLIDLSHSIAGNYLEKCDNLWDSLKDLKGYIFRLGNSLGRGYVRVNDGIWVHVSAKISPSAAIYSPCIIDEGSEVRHCAFLRGGVIVGRNCVIGNSTEIKNSILFDNVCVPHFNYIGDSVLGYMSHFGAGAITSNVRLDKSKIWVGEYCTNLVKFGSIVGDCAEIGCNSVLNPGTIIGNCSLVYPLSSVRGIIPPYSIFKCGGIYPKRCSRG